jgi:hypothetical protein
MLDSMELDKMSVDEVCKNLSKSCCPTLKALIAEERWNWF